MNGKLDIACNFVNKAESTASTKVVTHTAYAA